MSDSLVIAPQWIGDAVMTEPLLRRLHARGERLTVGALPWVAPVYRAMPQVAEVIEFPFQHGGLQFTARRRLARELQGRFDTAYVLPNSLKSALLPFLASIPQRVGYLGEARVGLLTHRLKNPKDRPPMVAFYSALSGERDGLEQDRPRLQLRAGGDRRGAAASSGCRAAATRVRARRRVRPGQALAGAHYAALAAPLDAAGAAARLRQGRAAVRGDRARQRAERCRNLAGKTSLAEAFALIAGARADGQQRLGPDARGRRLRRAAGGAVRLVEPAAHAAAERRARRWSG